VPAPAGYEPSTAEPGFACNELQRIADLNETGYSPAADACRLGSVERRRQSTVRHRPGWLRPRQVFTHPSA
jgi:hypothetical protein